MTNQEAIEILKDLWRYEHSEKFSEKEIRNALEKGIEALKNQSSLIEEFEKINERKKKNNFWKYLKN